MQNLLKRLWQDATGPRSRGIRVASGPDCLAAAATIKTLGQSINNVFSNANAALTGYTT